MCDQLLDSWAVEGLSRFAGRLFSGGSYQHPGLVSLVGSDGKVSGYMEEEARRQFCYLFWWAAGTHWYSPSLFWGRTQGDDSCGQREMGVGFWADTTWSCAKRVLYFLEHMGPMIERCSHRLSRKNVAIHNRCFFNLILYSSLPALLNTWLKYSCPKDDNDLTKYGGGVKSLGYWG